jgi:hypothetical protein
VQLDPVQAGRDSALRGVDELRDDAGKLLGEQSPRALEGLHALLGVDLAGRCHRRRRNGLQTRDGDVADPARVHELGDDLAAAAVDRVRDQRPAGDVIVGVQARRVRVALTDGRRLRAFGDDQPGGRALAVVLRGQLGRGLAGAGAVARQRRHDEAVGELERTQRVRGEQISHVVLLGSGGLLLLQPLTRETLPGCGCDPRRTP